MELSKSIKVRCVEKGCRNEFYVTLEELKRGFKKLCEEHRRKTKWSRKTLP